MLGRTSVFCAALIAGSFAYASPPSAATIVEMHLQRAAEHCSPDDLATIIEARIVHADEARKLTDGQMDVPPNSAYLLTVGQFDEHSERYRDSPTSWSLQPVAPEAQDADFKAMIGTQVCDYNGGH